jgi:hypothetical protein
MTFFPMASFSLSCSNESILNWNIIYFASLEFCSWFSGICDKGYDAASPQRHKSRNDIIPFFNLTTAVVWIQFRHHIRCLLSNQQSWLVHVNFAPKYRESEVKLTENIKIDNRQSEVLHVRHACWIDFLDGQSHSFRKSSHNIIVKQNFVRDSFLQRSKFSEN